MSSKDVDVGDNLPGRLYTSRYGSAASMVMLQYPCVMYKNPTLTYSQAAGAMSSDYSNSSMLQLYDSDDTAWRIYNLVADAEIG